MNTTINPSNLLSKYFHNSMISIIELGAFQVKNVEMHIDQLICLSRTIDCIEDPRDRTCLFIFFRKQIDKFKEVLKIVQTRPNGLETKMHKAASLMDLEDFIGGPKDPGKTVIGYMIPSFQDLEDELTQGEGKAKSLALPVNKKVTKSLGYIKALQVETILEIPKVK